MKGSKMKKMLASMLVAAMAISIVPTRTHAVVNSSATEGEDRKLIGYFPSWAYKSEVQGFFDLGDLQWDELTHIQYSFGFVDPTTNKLVLGDKQSDIEEDFKDYKIMHKGKEIKIDPSLPYKGHFNIITQMKKMYPDVKVVMSVGGWAGSRGFYTMLDTDAGIEAFTNSCVDFVREYGFDGIDIDFEFPSETSQSGNPDDFDVSEPRRKTINARYNKMMKELRKKLDAASAEDGKTGDDKYLVSAAVSASSWVLGGVKDNSYAKELDFLSIMSYDYHGGWNHFVENQANIYSDPADTETLSMALPTLSADWTVKYYRGVLPPEKILMGIPYYTRGWENVSGGDGTGLHGVSNTPATGKYNIWGDPDKDGNIIPAGANPLWHVLNLADRDPKFKKYWDNVGKVPHYWQPDEKVFLSFEDEQSIGERLKYIEEKNLGGALIWVMSGDYGLNPNYVPGSTDINEGKYTYGNTLTKKLSDGLKAMGPTDVTTDAIEGEDNISVINADVTYDINYDHPNGEILFTVKNNTGEALPKDWTLQFDIPKSSIFAGVEGGTIISETTVGDFTRVVVKSAGWQDFPHGGTATLKAKSKICFSGIRNIRLNGKLPANQPGANGYLPVINGVSDSVVALNATFNKRAGITAIDNEDGDLTSQIKVPNGVNTKVAGVYRLEYSVTDSHGNTNTVQSKATVVPTEYANATPWDAGTAYNGKDLYVIYDGKIYKTTQWYTAPGTLPTNTAAYELVETLPDNTFVEDGEAILGDINGDGKVDAADLSAVAVAYNAIKGTASYKANLDLNSNGIVDLFDLTIVSKKIK